jgi:hypothetical protein
MLLIKLISAQARNGSDLLVQVALKYRRVKFLFNDVVLTQLVGIQV